MLNTDEREPDGATVSSPQALWLKQGLASARSTWKLVFAHHAPYTPHAVEDTRRMRWPFKNWGADAVLSGFYHVYERLSIISLMEPEAPGVRVLEKSNLPVSSGTIKITELSWSKPGWGRLLVPALSLSLPVRLDRWESQTTEKSGQLCSDSTEGQCRLFQQSQPDCVCDVQ
jgi:hypothetical protein